MQRSSRSPKHRYDPILLFYNKLRTAMPGITPVAS